ncbi:AzlD domain-containing protein [Verminephrobacter aporrectodeae]|uniref:AzlD domain-containing protein n=1 Tax=Verminephrobacter aporrectodeae TaxID=1110389 RepID=UPI00023768AB|nr:AzlD domain-containing protein [Verminephrobacter aporrectodeae]MCW8173886.1 hypothetical protein [Verminephrobacter aporrectodeae subsp. tuberculatae]MCW8197096.1 hypothetical protein [Verminephrobacter aporrectodeae subsp. tuberculatae]MCW8201456.1 hypothetical protein [Verminephrobacter aporrectodeae subsp. tuberculatae]MCW8206291.1 hypothetical protein [Verminephrobacter aporrectodeae subsp. tuberculatae]
MDVWIAILVSGGVSWLLRVAPFLLLRRIKLDISGPAVRFFNYASAIVMGGIIYGSLYGTRDDLFFGHIIFEDLLKLIVVFLSFVITLWSRKPNLALLICLPSYLLILSLFR